MTDFDAVPWWKCPAEKAVGYSPIIAKPKPGARPVDDEGRWIEGSAPTKVWCWSYYERSGISCLAGKPPRTVHDRTYVYKPGELEVAY